jgi:hypothetical protein
VVELPSAEPIVAPAVPAASPAQATPPVTAAVASAAPAVAPKKPASAPSSEKLALGKAVPKMDRPAETELPDPNVAPPRSTKSNVDEDALQQALAQAAQRAKGCHVPGGPTGNVRVSITFASSGEVTGATVQGALFSNTLEGECIAAKFRSVQIPPFTGGDFVAHKTVAIE